jgi:acetyl esterase
MKKTAIALLFTLSLSLLGQDAPAPQVSWKYPPEMPGAQVEVYREVEGVKLNAYIFVPEGHCAKDRKPAAVFFFGGGWRSGTPGQFMPQCLHLAKRGMVAITVDYRVASRHGVLPQDCVRDAKAAIRWVRANAERLGVDPSKVAAGGGSAGGHLAAATALLPGFEDCDNRGYSSTPDAMLLFNPAVVLAAVEGHPDLMPAQKLEDIAKRTDGHPGEVSPYHFVRPGLPPSIIFHGTNDEAVPFPTALLFQKAMSAAGNRCELKAHEGQPHGFFNPGRWKGEAGKESVNRFQLTVKQMDDFLVSLGYLKPMR